MSTTRKPLIDVDAIRAAAGTVGMHSGHGGRPGRHTHAAAHEDARAAQRLPSLDYTALLDREAAALRHVAVALSPETLTARLDDETRAFTAHAGVTPAKLRNRNLFGLGQ